MDEFLTTLLNALLTLLRRRRTAGRILPPPSGWQVGYPAAAEPDAQLLVLSPAELDRHVYLLGASGSGKTRLLELFLRQEMQRGGGFCLIDPHGDLTQSVLAYLYTGQSKAEPAPGAWTGSGRGAWSPGHAGDADRGPGERSSAPVDLDRLYLVEPFQREGLIGLNPLDPAGGPLHAHIGELVGIFRRLWSNSWGPRMEEVLRTTLLTLAQTDCTVAEAAPFLTLPEFRARVLARVDDPMLSAFFADRYDLLPDGARSTVAEPVLNKLGALLADPHVRGMLGQRDGVLSFRQLMDSGAWVLINCARGQLRDASSLLGSFVVAQLQSAALSRADTPEPERKPFTLFVDEFQHFRSEDFESILCEARKYRLRLVVAHQHLGQLDSALQNALFGNVATHLVFSVSPADAAVVARRFGDLGGAGVPVSPSTLVHLPVGKALVCRRGSPPVCARILPVHTPQVPAEELAGFAASLRSRYGKSLSEVEAEIASRLAPPPATGAKAGARSTGRRRAGRLEAREEAAERGPRRAKRGGQSPDAPTLSPGEAVRPGMGTEEPIQEADDA